MLTLDRLVLYFILLFAFLYTVSFGRWTWKRKNRFGAFMIFLLALTVLALPVYTLFFKR